MAFMRAYTSCHEIAISSNPVTAVMPDITKYCFGVAVICSFIINLLCAQRQRSPSRRLRRVRWNALFNAFIFPDFHACRPEKSKNRPENRVFGLVEPIISIFLPFFAVIFIFCGIARIFSVFFLCSRGRRYFTVIFDISDR